METRTFLSELDPGKLESILDEVVRGFNNSKQTVFDILPFATEFKFRALELNALLTTFNDLIPVGSRKRDLLTQSAIINWIHCTNKIEFAGFNSYNDTKKAITSQMPGDTKPEKETIDTLELLKETYKPIGTPFAQLGIDIVKIQKWHKILFFRADPAISGKFRKDGRQVQNQDGSTHIFPHHSIILNSLNNLFKITHHLWKMIFEVVMDPEEKLLYTFSLAAFVQFHFVDIHPFEDGNGRMCRFLSKIIIDTMCPLPFPMFPIRLDYLATLEQARKVDAILAPEQLCSLLFQVAINFYKKMIKEHTNQPFDSCFGADDEVDVRKYLETLNASQDEIESIIHQFNQLEQDQKIIVQVQNEQILLKKLLSVFIEDI